MLTSHGTLSGRRRPTCDSSAIMKSEDATFQILLARLAQALCSCVDESCVGLRAHAYCADHVFTQI